MNYSLKFSQVSKAAARAKFNRMKKNANNSGKGNNINYFENRFSTWWLGKDDDDENLSIYVVSTYHTKETLEKMYKTNCKEY